MNGVTIKNKSPEGKLLEATYLPERGMNMVSYKKDGLEVIDQSTREEFEKRSAGLGPLIGPHFYRRNPKTVKFIPSANQFPHINQEQDPFSHGISRYAPWKYEATENSIKGRLTGKDVWNDVTLAELEGQNFNMTFEAVMGEKGLQIELSVVSDTTSIVGIHYYYHLPQRKGKVISGIQKHYYDPNEKKRIPESWDVNNKQILTFDLNQHADFAFHPFPNPCAADILLDAVDYKLRTSYSSVCQENGWQLYHPAGASFVCIEPCSSQDPRHPNLTVSSIKINLEILD